MSIRSLWQGGSERRAVAFACLVMVLILVTYGGNSALSARARASGDDVRPPAAAGQFYPKDPTELRDMVDTLLADAPKSSETPIALMVPHAGYVFSGAVAARAYKQLEGHTYDVIVVIGPNHQDPTFSKVSVYAEGMFATPLGDVPVDTETANALLESSDRLVFDRGAQSKEHSVEVQLPFLQRIYPDGFKVVPIVIGQPTDENITALRDALVKVLAGKNALLIASTDMSHYPTYDVANEVDHATLAAVETLDPAEIRQNDESELAQNIEGLGCTLCGIGPVLTVTEAATALGANRATTLMYANSGDTPFGDRDRVVGYGAVDWWKATSDMATPSPKPETTADPAADSLSEQQKAWLVQLARHTLEGFLRTGVVPLVRDTPPELERPAGVFVTLTEDGELRGCIGRMVADTPLYLIVQKMALAAAFQDSRFPPVKADELPDLHYEISLLSPITRIKSAEEIQVGVHGVIIAKDGHQAVFLPQVAPEQGWDRDELLENLCLKAGLPADAWKQDAEFYVFTAEVFGDAALAPETSATADAAAQEGR